MSWYNESVCFNCPATIPGETPTSDLCHFLLHPPPPGRIGHLTVAYTDISGELNCRGWPAARPVFWRGPKIFICRIWAAGRAQGGRQGLRLGTRGSH